MLSKYYFGKNREEWTLEEVIYEWKLWILVWYWRRWVL